MMRHCLFFFSLILACYGWLPFGDPCRQTNWDGDVKLEQSTTFIHASANCTRGSIEWHYPKFGERIQVTWQPVDMNGRYEVCLLLAYMTLNDLSGIVIKSGEKKNERITFDDLYPDGHFGSENKDDKFCVNSDDDGVVEMLFEGGTWLYMTHIDYEVTN